MKGRTFSRNPRQRAKSHHHHGGRDLHQKFDVIIDPNAASVCDTFGPNSVFQKADDERWNASRSQPCYTSEPSRARLASRPGRPSV